jgi:hypothetical protein
MKRTDPYIRVEGPAWGDAQLYGQWLQAAANAEAFWNKSVGLYVLSELWRKRNEASHIW